MKQKDNTVDNQPLSNLKWRDRDKLKPNDYNPNKVPQNELKLLKISIKESGWTQPIVINKKNEIVDGYHRWLVSADPDIGEATKYKVPCVIMAEGSSIADQMAATVTHNRARGSHHVLKMADMVRSLKDTHGVSEDWIKENLGMEKEEVERLYDNSGAPSIMGDSEYNKGWGLDEGRFDT